MYKYCKHRKELHFYFPIRNSKIELDQYKGYATLICLLFKKHNETCSENIYIISVKLLFDTTSDYIFQQHVVNKVRHAVFEAQKFFYLFFLEVQADSKRTKIISFIYADGNRIFSYLTEWYFLHNIE